MPGLPDLPPELIDQIHREYETLLIDGRPPTEMAGVAEDLGNFRLTSRYIERATRHSFVEVWFGSWSIDAPDDESIQRFCTMAKTPDLAASVRELNLFVDDDYSMKVQEVEPELDATVKELKLHQRKTLTSPPPRDATHVFDDVTGGLVPVAYHRNREALVEAFRACENVAVIWFCNRPLDLERMDQYKREGVWNSVSAENNGEDEGEDEDEDGDEDGDEDQDEHEDEEDDEDENEDENADGEEDEVEDEQQNGDEEEHAHDHCDHRLILFDVTSSYFYVLFLAGEAGLCPQAVRTFHKCSEHHCAYIRLGLTDCAGLATAKSALQKLETLKIDFIEDHHESSGYPEAVGARLGQQISEGFKHTPMLKDLDLNFELKDSVYAWSVLAKAPVIPTLQNIQLQTNVMDMHDFTHFMSKHSATWKSICIGHLHLTDGSMDDLGKLYELLSRAPHIEEFLQRSLLLGLGEDHEHVKLLSRICYPLLVDDEDEDGFVEICQTGWIRWKGHEEVTEGLGVMAEHLRVD